jgi:hypothetical protein
MSEPEPVSPFLGDFAAYRDDSVVVRQMTFAREDAGMSVAGQPGKNASERAGLVGREQMTVAHVATLAGSSQPPEMVDLTAMLQRITGDLERANADFRGAQEQLEAARAHRDELLAMRDGTLLLVERYGQADAGRMPG